MENLINEFQIQKGFTNNLLSLGNFSVHFNLNFETNNYKFDSLFERREG